MHQWLTLSTHKETDLGPEVQVGWTNKNDSQHICNMFYKTSKSADGELQNASACKKE